MGIYSEAPEIRSFSSDKPTLLVCWWCTIFAATIILLRVSGRYIRTERLFREDWLAALCLLPLFVRMGLVHVVLTYGTNNMRAPPGGWSDEEIWKRQVGSRLVLASRVFYAATLWMLKLTITEFFKRLTSSIWKRSYELMLRGLRLFLIATFVVSVIANISECHPVADYWQVNQSNPPVKASCRQGFAQLLTMGICNMVTDLLLIVFPIPIIIGSQMPTSKKANLVLLFSLSIIPVIITAYRLPHIIERNGVQQYRSLWASIEILLATGVANALVLGSFVRDRGVKKVKWKLGSTGDSIERTSSRRGTLGRIAQWGSDEDLVRDMGISLDPKLRDLKRAARPAPMAIDTASRDVINQNWCFPETGDVRKAIESYESSAGGSDRHLVQDGTTTTTTNQSASTQQQSRKVSFFDIGGLLDEPTHRYMADEHKRLSAVSDFSIAASSYDGQSISPMTTRNGSQALLQDVGGLAICPTSPVRSSSLSSRAARPWLKGSGGDGFSFELQSIPQEAEGDTLFQQQQQQNSQGTKATLDASQHMELQDIGRLLS